MSDKILVAILRGSRENARAVLVSDHAEVVRRSVDAVRDHLEPGPEFEEALASGPRLVEEVAVEARRRGEPQYDHADPDFSHFGACPECGREAPYTNAGKTHVFYCKGCKTRWVAGINLFSSWRNETEEERRRAWDKIGLDHFREVKPIHDGDIIRRVRTRFAARRTEREAEAVDA